jgi:DNA-binding XRE family transcriptional regulator
MFTAEMLRFAVVHGSWLPKDIEIQISDVPPRATSHPSLKKLGRFVRQTRLAKKMSQEDLAGVAGLDRTYISHLERGLRNPSLLHLQRLSRALGIAPAEFFGAIQ